MNWRRFRVPWRSQGKRGIGMQCCSDCPQKASPFWCEKSFSRVAAISWLMSSFARKMSGVAGIWRRLQWYCGGFSGNGRVCTRCGAVFSGVEVDCKDGGAVCKVGGTVFKGLAAFAQDVDAFARGMAAFSGELQGNAAGRAVSAMRRGSFAGRVGGVATGRLIWLQRIEPRL